MKVKCIESETSSNLAKKQADCRTETGREHALFRAVIIGTYGKPG